MFKKKKRKTRLLLKKISNIKVKIISTAFHVEISNSSKWISKVNGEINYTIKNIFLITYIFPLFIRLATICIIHFMLYNFYILLL